MDPSEILEIIKAFFGAIRSLLEAMGVLEPKAEAE